MLVTAAVTSFVLSKQLLKSWSRSVGQLSPSPSISWSGDGKYVLGASRGPGETLLVLTCDEARVGRSSASLVLALALMLPLLLSLGVELLLLIAS